VPDRDCQFGGDRDHGNSFVDLRLKVKAKVDSHLRAPGKTRSLANFGAGLVHCQRWKE